MRGLTLLCFALVLRGDDGTQKLVKRLGDEASAFQRVAPTLVGRETLHQRALAPPRFKMRVGDAAKQAQAADWKEHEIVSEYAFALLGRQIHELRQVTSVDGKRDVWITVIMSANGACPQSVVVPTATPTGVSGFPTRTATPTHTATPKATPPKSPTPAVFKLRMQAVASDGGE